MAIKRCKTPFAVVIDGAPRVITVGQLVDGDDPIVRGREANFEDVETYVSSRKTRVEEATAAPGAKRSVGRPPAKKAAESRKASEKPETKPDSDSAGGAS
ncbi:hypothetical protein [Streptomyces sp. NPDC013489]|uniref:hypothetical protein n=1 Tax=Streptomyces sp. NPDC013489 TaxID=3155606 RepID=UPI0033E0C724